MNDFNVCLGTGDIPTPDMDDYNTNQEQTSQNKNKEKEYLNKGYIKDSTNKWYNPKNYIDCLYADW